MAGPEIESLIRQISKLPGLGPRSARRIALALIKKRNMLLDPLVHALTAAADRVRVCSVCSNYDSQDPCVICSDPKRDPTIVCVVEDVADLWAMERALPHHRRQTISARRRARAAPADSPGPARSGSCRRPASCAGGP